MVASALRAADGVVLDAALHMPVGHRARGAVVQVHGINADMDEGGMFRRLADGLTVEGFGVMRFSFRGHGRSDGGQQATSAGEILDLQAAVDAAREGFGAPLSVVAASFGAVSTCLSLPYLEGVLGSLVLWNPNDGTASAGLRLGDARAHALLQALLVFSLLPNGFLNRDLRGLLAGLLGNHPHEITAGQVSLTAPHTG